MTIRGASTVTDAAPRSDASGAVPPTTPPARRRADVVLVASSFWPREGGAERQLRHVLGAATRAGLQCVVLTHALPGHPRRAEIDGVPVVRVGSGRLMSCLPKVGRLVGWFAQLGHLLRLRPHNAISIQLGAASVVVALARRLCGLRHIIRLTGGGSTTWRSEPWFRRSSWSGRLMVRLAARRGVVVVSPAQHLLVDLDQAFPELEATTQVITNGVPEPGPGEAVDADRSGVLWYARGGGVRSSPAFVRIAEACPDLSFTAIGRTDELPASAPVRRLGWVDDPYEVMHQCRILLNTSPTEGMPNTALQALAAGLYVVGPANEGLAELAESYPGRVTLVDITEPSAVADSLRAVHDAPLPGRAPVPRSADVAKTWVRLFREGAQS